MIKDTYGRQVNNLRLSVTQRCNLRCFYCHSEGEDYHSHVEMTTEEIRRIVNVAVSLGLNKVKLTGGEPLLRPDFVGIVSTLSQIPCLQEVSMTTNGISLVSLAKPLKAAGLSRVNISLGTLNSDTYQIMTGVNAINQVLAGIKAAREADLFPIKINMVILKGVNDDEVPAMIDFTKDNGLILQLIEFEAVNSNTENFVKYHSDLDKIETVLSEKAHRTIIRKMNKRRKFLLKDGGEIEVVKPMHNTAFCKYCSRLRVTSDGKFKPCLFRSDNLVDFLTPMRSGARDEELVSLLLDAVNRRKPYFMEGNEKATLES